VSDIWVERVRTAVDLVEVIGETVELRKAGASFKGLCPFHQEKTPSFIVNPDRQVYHCFGCGVGGDVFSFVMASDGVTFPEALRHLARRAGIALPETRGLETGEILLRILEESQELFRETLLGRAGKAARDYLKGRRISDRIRSLYGVGLAPDGWRGLTETFRTRYDVKDLVRAGVTVAPSEGGAPYDRFRNRITFPVARPGGKIVGFGARALGDEEPKYLNSPEGPLYRKGEVLFGLPAARDELRRRGTGLLVEGYFDVLSLNQIGIEGAVAPCGTALTAAQGTLLQRNAGRWILFFDGDAAGQKATWRALEVLLGIPLDVKIAPLPSGSDPDDVAAGGRDAVMQILKGALDPVDWLHHLAPGESRRSWLLDRSATLIGWVRDPLQRHVWIEKAASRLRVPEAVLWDAVRGRAAGGRQPSAKTGPPQGLEGQKGRGIPKPLSPLERDLVVLALEQPDVRRQIADRAREAPSVGPGVRGLLDWMAALDPAPGAAQVTRKIEETEGMGGATGFLVDPAPGCATPEFRDGLLRRLTRDRLRDDLRRVKGRLKSLEAGREGTDPDALRALQEEADKLARELEALLRQ